MGGYGWRRDLEKQRARRQEIDENPPKCALCGKVIQPPRRYVGNVKYCTPAHSAQARKVKAREKAALAGAATTANKGNARTDPYPDDKIRRGPLLEKIKGELNPAELDEWVTHTISDVQVAARVEASVTAVGMARRAHFNDRLQQVQNAGWTPKPEHAAMLGPSDNFMQKMLATQPPLFETKLDTLVEAFVDWRTEFFSVGFNVAYITKPVHKRWIKATLRTIYTGGRQLVLSPPRHGKTELLIHFCVWLICRNPHIRILWVGPNGDIAENCLGQTRDLLESHDTLREAYLPPGVHWAPQKKGGGALWQRTKFTVANREVMLKQPTMWCTGVEGKILSIDADFIVVDDPADPDKSYTQGGREKIDNWFKVKLMTRKMQHTGLAMISSRVHPDDLYAQFIDSDLWTVIVDRAHDAAICGLGLWESHDHLPDPDACVLFPEVNPLDYLREQADVVGESLFEMMYLNQPRPDGSMIFDIDKIRNNCLDMSRTNTTEALPGSYRLVAGLDPAARGVQAAFLWAVTLPSDVNPRDPSQRGAGEAYYMIDSETQQGGGIEGALRVIESWFQLYGVDLWVIEDNVFDEFFRDPRMKTLTASLGVTIRPTHTGRNKHDPDFGVAAMAPLFHEGKVVLPYGNPDAQRKTDAYLRQLLNFTGDTKTGGRKALSDILMASWFPHATVIKKWRREERSSRVQPTTEVSYPALGQTTGDTPFWGETFYPNTTDLG